jgi:hypothetical protein
MQGGRVVVRCLTKRNGNEKNAAAAPGTGNVRAAADGGGVLLCAGLVPYRGGRRRSKPRGGGV